MGLFDNFKKRNKARKERNIRRETIRRAAAGDTSDYVKKQMQKYGTSLEDFKSNPDDVGTGILAGSPGFTPSGPRTADQFVDQQNRIRQLQKELRGIVDQKSSLTSQPSTMGLTNAYQDAIRQFKDRGDLAQRAFRQELPNPLIKAAQGIGSFIRGGGLLGVLMRALDDQNKQVNVANQSFRSPQDMESLTDPDGAGITTSDPSGFRYNSETGQFERVPNAQVMDGEAIQKAAEARQMAAARQAGAENMYNQMFGQPISMGKLFQPFPSGIRNLSVNPSMIPDGETLQKEREAYDERLDKTLNPLFNTRPTTSNLGLVPDMGQFQKRSIRIDQPTTMLPLATALTPYEQSQLTQNTMAIQPNEAMLNQLDPNLNPNIAFVPNLPMQGPTAMGFNMGGDVMMERTMDPTYAKLKIFNDTAYE
jgi:HPt (histidine-containing phosphotransfer) domain-containing protein